MGKKEFYEKYIQDNRTEDEKMMDIIHRNAQKGREDKLYSKKHNQRNKGIFGSHRGMFAINLIEILLLVLILVKLWI